MEGQHVVDEFDKKKREVGDRRAVLNSLNEEKEKWFSEKESVGKEIVALISQIREYKRKRNDLTAKVREFKAKKESVVSTIKDKIAQISEVRKEKGEYVKKHDQGDPVRLKREIEQLETKMETEVFSFETEQKLMKKLKELKLKYGEFAGYSEVAHQLHGMSSEIDQLKVEEKELKKGIRHYARESQVEHEKMLTESKKVDELKEKEKVCYDKFIESKNRFTEENNKLKELLGEVSELGDSVRELKEEKRKDKEHREKLTLEEKKNMVQEKIKKGGKLTTEDLLIFQRD